MKVADYMIVGSGCSGAMAAQTLVEAGVNVAMIDVGTQGSGLEATIPDEDYLSLRRSDSDQYKYLIGPDGEGIAWNGISKGAQITPTRSYISDLTSTYLPFRSKTFSPLESLSYGGLGIGWGLQCWEYSDADLRETGLDPVRMRAAYETVSRRIGISADDDDAAAYTIGPLKSFQPAAAADRNHQYILRKYAKRAGYFRRHKVHVGRTPLALATQDTNGRTGYQYDDMDFYANKGHSAWRPYVTVDALRKLPNFSYINAKLVVSFSEAGDIVTIRTIDTETNKEVLFHCRHLILASGALGTARIILRALGGSDSRLSLLSNPHSYIPCVQPALVGKGSEAHKLGFGQLSYFIDKEGVDSGISVATSYSYQSLMLFRLIRQIPLNFFDSRTLTSFLSTGLIILIAQHPDKLSPAKYLQLRPSGTSPTGDTLHAEFALTDAEQAEWHDREKQYMSVMRKLQTYPLKSVDPGHGSGIHYAGTIPFSQTSKKFALDPSGRLHGTRHVYVADSSGFTFLPAKGLTFSLMANAHITAQNVLKNR